MNYMPKPNRISRVESCPTANYSTRTVGNETFKTTKESRGPQMLLSGRRQKVGSKSREGDDLNYANRFYGNLEARWQHVPKRSVFMDS
jgi:hypothetical protein